MIPSVSEQSEIRIKSYDAFVVLVYPYTCVRPRFDTFLLRERRYKFKTHYTTKRQIAIFYRKNYILFKKKSIRVFFSTGRRGEGVKK